MLNSCGQVEKHSTTFLKTQCVAVAVSAITLTLAGIIQRISPICANAVLNLSPLYKISN